MGDGCLIENSSRTNYRLQIEHSQKQRDYVFWLYEIFKNFVLSPPKYLAATNSWKFRNTQNFTEAENKRLLKFLAVSLDLPCLSLHRDRKYFRLFVRKQSMAEFRNLFVAHIQPDMRYKIDYS